MTRGRRAGLALGTQWELLLQKAMGETETTVPTRPRPQTPVRAHCRAPGRVHASQQPVARGGSGRAARSPPARPGPRPPLQRRGNRGMRPHHRGAFPGQVEVHFPNRTFSTAPSHGRFLQTTTDCRCKVDSGEAQGLNSDPEGAARGHSGASSPAALPRGVAASRPPTLPPQPEVGARRCGPGSPVSQVPGWGWLRPRARPGRELPAGPRALARAPAPACARLGSP